MRMAAKARFLNVDLDIRAKEDLAGLVRAFEPGAFALNCSAVEDGYFASLELASQPTEPDAAIIHFVRLIETLPPHARAAWDGAFERDFSIGIEAGVTPYSAEFALTPTALKLAAGVGAGVTFVVYAADDERGTGK
jgi:hypothetical protein